MSSSSVPIRNTPEGLRLAYFACAAAQVMSGLHTVAGILVVLFATPAWIDVFVAGVLFWGAHQTACAARNVGQWLQENDPTFNPDIH